MTAAGTAHLLLLLALLGAAACEARSGPLLLGHSRRHLLQAQLPASDAAGTGAVVTTGHGFVAALLNADVRTVLLRGQLLLCSTPSWPWRVTSPPKGPCNPGRCASSLIDPVHERPGRRPATCTRSVDAGAHIQGVFWHRSSLTRLLILYRWCTCEDAFQQTAAIGCASGAESL